MYIAQGTCDEWILGGEWSEDKADNVIGGTKDGGMHVIWASTDILNTTDNSVYLSASEPVPVEE